jgi:hypothetical protein
MDDSKADTRLSCRGGRPSTRTSSNPQEALNIVRRSANCEGGTPVPMRSCALRGILWPSERSNVYHGKELPMRFARAVERVGWLALLTLVSSSCSRSNTPWAWGDNDSGQVGDNSSARTNPVPILVSNPTGAVAVAAGMSHSLAFDSSGRAWAWGGSGAGQLGDDTLGSSSSVPAQVSDLTRRHRCRRGRVP